MSGEPSSHEGLAPFGDKPKSERCVVVSVEWGDDQHDCPMAMRTWRRIVKGAVVRRVEPYVYEGQRFVGEWHFNRDGFGTLVVNYDDGGVGFDGSLSNATITIDGEPFRWDETVAGADGAGRD